MFIIWESYAAVGFVLALKGIIRHAELTGENAQKIAEYVLIGTMISLSWTIVVAALARWLLG